MGDGELKEKLIMQAEELGIKGLHRSKEKPIRLYGQV
jgi:hypothetical protein